MARTPCVTSLGAPANGATTNGGTTNGAPAHGASSHGVTSGLSPVAEKERQLVWLLTRQLAEAQAMPGGQARVERLWQEVAALEIDPDRVIALLYGGHDLSDRAVLAALDPGVEPRPSARSPRWIPQGAPGLMRWLNRGGGRRTGPPVTPPAHPAGR